MPGVIVACQLQGGFVQRRGCDGVHLAVECSVCRGDQIFESGLTGGNVEFSGLNERGIVTRWIPAGQFVFCDLLAGGERIDFNNFQITADQCDGSPHDLRMSHDNRSA